MTYFGKETLQGLSENELRVKDYYPLRRLTHYVGGIGFSILLLTGGIAACTFEAEQGKCRPGDRVVLFSETEFRGDIVRFEEDDANLGDDNINDRVRSLRICTPESRRVQIALFRHINYQGQSEVFVQSDSNLSDNYIGSAQASSIMIQETP